MNDARAKAIALGCMASPLLVIAVIGVDAGLRRERSRALDPLFATVASRLPTSDLALAGGARWLRSPSLEEPGAAFADGPALPDPDPAGGAIAPPIEVWIESAARSSPDASPMVKRNQ